MISPLNTCPKIISLGMNLGVPLKYLCNIEWGKVKGNKHFQSQCSSTTSGRIKDTCKISCEECNQPQGNHKDL